MPKWSRQTPDGMRDYLFCDAARRRLIENEVEGVFARRGYKEIITPVVEYLDVFVGGGSFVPPEDMYKLFDTKGRILALRHDMTTPIARVAGTKLKEASLPLKLCYTQNVFRSNEDLAGKRNEITQCGAEIIGLNNEKADLEIIMCAMEVLKATGAQSFTLELGHIGFFKAVMEGIDESDELRESIRRHIEKKNFAALNDELAPLNQSDPHVIALRCLPRLFGGIEVLDQACEIAPNERAKGTIKDLRSIISRLNSLGLGSCISIDLGMVHHIGYYTGIIFRGYIAGSGDNCLFGGRYDSLSQNFGANLPSTGFALSVDSVLDTLSRGGLAPKVDLHTDVLIFYQDGLLNRASELFEKLSKEGKRCELCLHDDIESSFSYALVCGARLLYELKSDEERLYYKEEGEETWRLK